MSLSESLSIADLKPTVSAAVERQVVTDLHTHVYSPRFGASPDLPAGSPMGLLWGIDDLLTYHYLVAEVLRITPGGEAARDRFMAVPKAEQADHIWQKLFVERTPISEACRGVITTLTSLGLDPRDKTLDGYRRWFGEQDADAFVDRVMQIANVDCITMTNEVFNAAERELWLREPGLHDDPRFAAVLRIDAMLLDWPRAMQVMRTTGYEVGETLDAKTVREGQRFLCDWIKRMRAVYVAVSLPPTFRYPLETPQQAQPGELPGVLEKIVLPALADIGLPFAMMIGARRGVNPALAMAGDGLGKADVDAVNHLCADFPRQKFLVTMLSRENQHELCVAARKFANLMVFGCWWFLNNPSLIKEITRMRLELLGTSFIPQHSDARIIDQLIYKWNHSRRILAEVLAEKYHELAQSGYEVTSRQIEHDVALLLHDNYRTFVQRG